MTRLLTNMAGINRKPAWMRQLGTRMGGLYCIRLCNQVRSPQSVCLCGSNTPGRYDYNCCSFKPLSHVMPSIRKMGNAKLRTGSRSETGFAPAELIRNMPRDRTSAQLLTEDQGLIVSAAFLRSRLDFHSLCVSNRSTRRFQKP